MKAIAVLPGRPDSVHLAELDKPAVSDIPNGRGVLVRVLRVGVDGTDKEINAAEYGAAPDGYTFLVIGHEGFGRVEAVGPNVTFLRPGDFVVATVRRPGTSIYDAIGLQDMTTDDHYFGDDYRVECPTGSGRMITLGEVAEEMSRRLTRIFLLDQNGRRPVFGPVEQFQRDPNWRDLIPFHEYFHGDTGAGVGASHQTGWTALVAKLLQQSGV